MIDVLLGQVLDGAGDDILKPANGAANGANGAAATAPKRRGEAAGARWRQPAIADRRIIFAESSEL